MSDPRIGWKWTLRYWFASVFNHWSWALSDPHNAWAVEYRGKEDGRKYMQTITGKYSQAKAFAKEHKGKIVGSDVQAVCHEDDADWWKPL